MQSESSPTGRIRAIPICVFRVGNRILVAEGYDPTKDQVFYRPPGGGIDFGEPSEVALRREMKEELGVDIQHPDLIGVLENLFTCDGQPGHEVVFVYDATLPDRTLYAAESLPGTESDGTKFNAIWLDLDAIRPETPPVYPDGLVEMVRGRTSGGAEGFFPSSWFEVVQDCVTARALRDYDATELTVGPDVLVECLSGESG